METIMGAAEKPHAVCIPFPAQGHINPMMQLAKLLHSRGGFHITFVNTEFNHRRFLGSKGADALNSHNGFHFETIPDGLPQSDRDATQDIRALCESTRKNCLAPLVDLVKNKLNSASYIPRVSCIISDGIMNFGIRAAEELGIPGVHNISDGIMSFGIRAAEELGIPGVQLWTASACGFMGCLHLGALSVMLNAQDQRQVQETPLMKPIMGSSSLWKEDSNCLLWLDKKEPNSVLYVNFGSFTVRSEQRLKELAWGLVNSNKTFLWIIRPDVEMGYSAILPEGFFNEITKDDRGLLTSWCSQDQVLSHPAIGGFFTHCGWNSTLESLCNGVPMICWPFYADQQTNCLYACHVWGIGVEIDSDAKRDRIEEIVKEVMEGKKAGKKRKDMALRYWKDKVEEATTKGGSSYNNFGRLTKEVLCPKDLF